MNILVFIIFVLIARELAEFVLGFWHTFWPYCKEAIRRKMGGDE